MVPDEEEDTEEDTDSDTDSGLSAAATVGIVASTVVAFAFGLAIRRKRARGATATSSPTAGVASLELVGETGNGLHFGKSCSGYGAIDGSTSTSNPTLVNPLLPQQQ